ncbi:MAG: hypothetical protein HS111_17170 [Kofleriaceae bacterium]|nr:hypothetical protein [Kofleriaceae bacterium]MCL4223099.1 hypothetical protein [Myxococcales bacterium]
MTALIDSYGPPIPGGLERVGAATVTATSPLTLRFDDGAVHRVAFELPGGEGQVFTPDERVWAELAESGPFWVNHQIELYDLDASGGAGPLRLAVWWGEDLLGQVQGWDLTYEDSDCQATTRDTCGLAVSRSLRVAAPGGGMALLAPGASIDLDDYTVSNGNSMRYVATIECTDTPPTWSGGGLVRR